ncbi:MAG: hypothetical protein ABL958_14560 [Bdellovibrionia bacterium]
MKILNLIFLFACGLAHANTENPQIMPLGETEAFMANTGVAEIGSSGSVFFNPGALATVKSSKISLSGAAYTFFNFKSDSVVRIENKDLSYNADGFNSIPFSVNSTTKKGEWILALSLMETDMRTYENKVGWETTNYDVKILQNLSQSEMWLGGGAARMVSEKVGLGVSAFVLRRIEQVTNTTFVNSKAAPTSDASYTTGRDQLSLIGFVLLLGGHYTVNEDTQLGMRIRLPMLQFSGNLDSFGSSQLVQGGVITKVESDQNGVKAYGQFPADFAFGVSRRVSSTIRLLADLGIQMGSDYALTDQPASPRFKTNPTARLNTGAEYRLTDNGGIRAGLLYNPSARGALVNEGEGRLDYFMLTAGYLFQDEHLMTGIGGFYQWSVGEVIPEGAPGSRSAVYTKAFGAILTTGYVF